MQIINTKSRLFYTVIFSFFVAATAVAEPAKSSLQLCEEKTKAFLKTNYCGDQAVPKTFFSPEFAALWLKACNPPEGEPIYWGCDPILETQDTEPKLLGIGPAESLEDKVFVPVGYKHAGQSPYKKIFVFEQHKGRWVISDILTDGVIDHTTGERTTMVSEFQKLAANLGN